MRRTGTWTLALGLVLLAVAVSAIGVDTSCGCDPCPCAQQQLQPSCGCAICPCQEEQGGAAKVSSLHQQLKELREEAAKERAALKEDVRRLKEKSLRHKSVDEEVKALVGKDDSKATKGATKAQTKENTKEPTVTLRVLSLDGAGTEDMPLKGFLAKVLKNAAKSSEGGGKIDVQVDDKGNKTHKINFNALDKLPASTPEAKLLKKVVRKTAEEIAMLKNRTQALEDRLNGKREPLSAKVVDRKPNRTEEEELENTGSDERDLSVVLYDPFRNYGNSYDSAGAWIEDDLCTLTSLIEGSGGLVMRLPRRCRPKGRAVFSVWNTNSPARVDVLPDGRVYHIAGGSNGYISLNGISFSTRVGYELELEGDWEPYGFTYRKPSVTQHGPVCALAGLIKGTQWTFLAKVPAFCRPSKRIVFSVANHGNVARVDLLPDGRLLWAGGHKDNHWVSLDGITYAPNQGGDELKLMGDWKPYGGVFRSPRFDRVQNQCLLSGLLLNTVQWTREIGVIPTECRPQRRLVNTHMSSARVDILKDCKIVYIEGKLRWNWLSLDGIQYTVSVGSEKLHESDKNYLEQTYHKGDQRKGASDDQINANPHLTSSRKHKDVNPLDPKAMARDPKELYKALE